jgi:putative SOS response-associated peptidase YedK
MCAQYVLTISTSTLCKSYNLPQQQDYSLDFRVLPTKASIVIAEINGAVQFQKMTYGLVPNWSQEAKVKFATYNARVESLLEKPTWKQSFISRRCLVPLTEFIESITEKKYAGHMIRLSEVNGRLLTAAGLWDSWIDPVTGKAHHSFAILTSEPPEFVAEAGHDRCPIFLKPEAFLDWLNPSQKDPVFLLKLLKEKVDLVDFKAEIDRPLKSGWEKRK